MKLVKRIALVLCLGLPIALIINLGCGGDDNSVEPQCYDLTVDVEGEGDVSIDPDTNCYHTGNTVTLEAVPGDSYVFDYWEGNITWQDNAQYLSTIEVTVGTTDIELTAHFKIELNLTLDYVPINGGMISIDQIQNYYEPGDTAILEAIPYNNYVFQRWTINDEIKNQNPIIVVFDSSDVEVIAYFYIPEGEPDCGDGYVDNYNGGCSSDPVVFQSINNGDRIGGISGVFVTNDTLFRDTDWYEYTVPANRHLGLTVEADFAVLAFILVDLGGCDSIYVVDVDSTTIAGQSISLGGTVPAGTYYLWIGPNEADWDCPVEYTAAFTVSSAIATSEIQPVPIDKKRLSNIFK